LITHIVANRKPLLRQQTEESEQSFFIGIQYFVRTNAQCPKHLTLKGGASFAINKN
jgi:hypothetical protein